MPKHKKTHDIESEISAINTKQVEMGTELITELMDIIDETDDMKPINIAWAEAINKGLNPIYAKGILDTIKIALWDPSYKDENLDEEDDTN